MSLEYPDNLRYTDSHEYVELTATVAKVGVSAFAVDQLGDIVFVDLPEVGDEIVKGSAFGTIESVKAVEDLKAPISGKVIKRNDAAIDTQKSLVPILILLAGSWKSKPQIRAKSTLRSQQPIIALKSRVLRNRRLSIRAAKSLVPKFS
jgi:glycine cleavage system H protein